MLRSFVRVALFVSLTAATAPAATEVCGDLDGSGSLVASDALLLLKRAVGQNVNVECPDCAEPHCAALGESCTVTEDCCPVENPPPIVGGASSSGVSAPVAGPPAPCCGGTCQAFGVCKADGETCVCGAECCSGSCGQQVVGKCD